MRLFRRIAWWLRASSNEADLAQELMHHRAMVERDLIAAGQSPAEARDAARRAMGNAKYTLRSLRRTPGFTTAVMITLALGIGANAAMFSLIDRIFFRPPPMLIDPATAHRIYLYKQSSNQSNPGEREAGSQYALNADIMSLT